MSEVSFERRLTAAADAVREDGFAVLPEFLPVADLAPALGELGLVYPTAADLQAEPSSEVHRPFFADQFAGQRELPFAAPQLSLLCAHPSMVRLAAAVLDTSDLRLYAGEAWAKYSGAALYEQEHHRDNHSFLVPSGDETCKQVELFVLLADVDESDGPPAFVPSRVTSGVPNERYEFTRDEYPALYDNEVLGVGSAGTVIAFRSDTVHRATELSRPGGARFTLHAAFRAASTEWFSRHAWGDRSYLDGWAEFVALASYNQLLLFGFPPAGHRYWTPDTIARTRVRYPGIDLTDWERPEA